MQLTPFISPDVDSILDVGCNEGAWLDACTQRYRSARLAGVDINDRAIAVARGNVPGVDIRRAGAEALPFDDGSFACVTCFEVLEHVPAELRVTALREIRRVLQPGGRLVLTVPHAGWFAWLDSNNVRLRMPRLYGRTLGRGLRDEAYAAMDREVEWHHHFDVHELEQLAGAGWRQLGVQHGGLLLYPLMDWLSWPFYRLGKSSHWLRRLFERIAGWENQFDFGSASYGVMLVLERVDHSSVQRASASRRDAIAARR